MEEKKNIKLIKNTTSYKMNIPADVEAKIRHLCSIIHDVEWSGILFYTCKGSFEKGDFEVTCVDICVMDIGNSGYTEFIDSPDIATYRIDNDLLGDIHEGLIHSHNKMSTFFSGTDLSTLEKEGSTSNHFVSLIVNNSGNYTAAVTRRIVTETKEVIKIKSKTNKYYNTFDDKKIVLEKNKDNIEEIDNEVKDETIEYFSFTINKENNNPFENLDNRLEEIRNKKKAKNKYKFNYVKSWSPYETYADSWELDLNKTSQSEYAKYPSKYQKDKEEKIQPKQLNLFEEEDIEELPLCAVETFDEDLIKDITAKLLTGNIFATSSLDLRTFVYNVDKRYAAYFGPLENNKRVEDYILGMLEFLTATPDVNLKKRAEDVDYPFTESDNMEVCAVCLRSYLKTLPKSYIVDKIIEMLEDNYIPDLY